MKIVKQFGIFLTFIVIISFIIPINIAHAEYNFDGFPIKWLIAGEINGDIFIEGGHGIDQTPYFEDFSIPKGEQIYWAGVFIGVWGGDEYNTGWVETKINETTIKNQELRGIKDDNENVLCSGNGVHLIYYNITTMIELDSTIEIRVDTGGITLDGRVYGIIMVVIYGDSSKSGKKFEFGYGNVGLHYLVQGNYYNTFNYETKDDYEISQFQSATLYSACLTGTTGELDSLYFNNHLLDSDFGDESSGGYFDLDCYDVSENLSSSNQIKFSRGMEGYIHPIIILLKAQYELGSFSGENYIEYNEEKNKYNSSGEFNWLYIIIPSILVLTVIVFTFQYVKKKKL
jgi:hypothetical protein